MPNAGTENQDSVTHDEDAILATVSKPAEEFQTSESEVVQVKTESDKQSLTDVNEQKPTETTFHETQQDTAEILASDTASDAQRQEFIEIQVTNNLYLIIDHSSMLSIILL